MLKKKIAVLVLIIASVTFLLGTASFADEVADIQAAIKAKGKKWVAGRTSMMMLSPEERRAHLGNFQAKGLPDLDAEPYQESFTAVPSTFDWRSMNDKNYVTPIRNQLSCGSCWAFAAAAGLESYTLMTQGKPGDNLDLAEQILISCQRPNGCSGGYPSEASAYIRSTGLLWRNVFLTRHMMPKTVAILFTAVRLARIGSSPLTRYWTMVPCLSPFPLLRMRC